MSVALNIIGQISRTMRRNRYILTVFDYLTKHVKENALPGQEKITFARVFYNELIA